MQRFLAGGLAAWTCSLVAAPAGAQLLDPNVTISTSLTSVAQSSSVSVLDLGTSGTNGLVSSQPVSFGQGASAGNITYTGTSGIYSGNVAGVTAAPYTASGATTGNYFAAEPKGGIIVEYATRQQYFGLQWGSVDAYNTLSFYQGNTLVEQLTGKTVTTNPNGARDGSNSYWVNLNFGARSGFDSVVFTSSNPAFEFNVVAYAATTQAITPEAVVAAGDTGKASAVTVPVNAAPIAASPLLALLVGALRRRRRPSTA